MNSDGEGVTSDGKSFHIQALATGKTQLLTVESLTAGKREREREREIYSPSKSMITYRPNIDNIIYGRLPERSISIYAGRL